MAAFSVGLVLSSSIAAEAAGPLEIGVTLGYNGAIKLGAWMPAAIDITNHGPEVDGTLEVDIASGAGKGGPPTGAAVYLSPLTLAPGATKHFRTYLSEEVQAGIDVRVLQGGHVVQTANLGAPNVISGLLVGVLSDDTGALGGIASTTPGGTAPTVAHLTGADLGDSALVLRGFDLIALDDFSTDTLTTDQRNALRDYVMQGGSLLLGTGGTWHKTLAGLPNAIVPMQVTGSTVLPSSSVLGGVSSVEVATGTVSAGASAWQSEGDRPLLLEAPVGAGLVTMSTFDWTQGTIAGSVAATRLLRQVVVRSTFGSPNGSPSASMTGTKGGGILNSVSARGGMLSQALGNVPALDLPAWWLIGGFVLLYIVVVGPLNYFVLRAMGRRALAWVTVPVIALVASGGAYGATVLTKGTSVLANEISIVHVQQGWDRAYDEAYTGIVAPTRGDYEVEAGGRNRMISPIDYYYGNSGDPSQGSLRVDLVTGGITLPSMTAFTLRGFASEEIGAAPVLVATTQIVGGQLRGTVHNGSSLEVTDGVVVAGGAYQTFGRLGLGATVPFSVQPTAANLLNGNPTYMQIYPSALCCGGPPNSNPDVERENEMRSGILQALTVSAYGGVPVVTSPMVVLWTKQPIQQVTVNGARPRTYVETAVVLTLTTGSIGVGALPAGIVSGRVVDLDATLTAAGPPGVSLANSGSIVYSFQPSLAKGAHLQSVSINGSNPYGPKFAAGPGASAAKGQAWNWATGSWADVAYADGATTSIPDSAVNPVTGEVRLKLSSDGQYTVSQLSLSGTVA